MGYYICLIYPSSQKNQNNNWKPFHYEFDNEETWFQSFNLSHLFDSIENRVSIHGRVELVASDLVWVVHGGDWGVWWMQLGGVVDVIGLYSGGN